MYKDLIIKILEATDYQGDKEAFVADFMHLISSQALVNLVQTLPEDKQLEADKSIAEASSQEDFAGAVKSYFTDQEVEQSVDIASQRAISEWLRSVSPTLNDEKREKLLKVSEEMQNIVENSSKK